jgi:hypothetical protein
MTTVTDGGLVDFRAALNAVAVTAPREVVDEIEYVVTRIGPAVSCVATGSIIEGFGNANSDIDLYLVDDAARHGQPTTVGMRRGRYVDCEHIPLAGLGDLAERVAGSTWATLDELSQRALDRYYRLAVGIPVVLTAGLHRILPLFQKTVMAEVFARWSTVRAYESLARAACVRAPADPREAELLLRETALWHATAVLAARGEAYPVTKWVGEKAARCFGRDSLRYQEILADYVRPQGDLADRLDRLRSRVDPPEALLAVVNGRSCRLADGVRLVSGTDEVILLRPDRVITRLRGVVADVCSHLAGGADWADATDRAARDTGVRPAEVRAACWRLLAPLRTAGYVEGR